MAAIFIFRIAIALTPVLTRICRTNGCDLNSWSNAIGRYEERVFDPAEDPDELSVEMTASLGAEGGEIIVSDFTGSFELRKLHWILERVGFTPGEDKVTCTFHFIKLSGGTPTSWAVDGSDLATLETALGTFWTGIKSKYPPFTVSDQYRWYHDGPAYYELNSDGTRYVPIGDNPAVRVTEVNVAGTAGATDVLPPQCAMTITERCSSRSHWGRFYLPAVDASNADAFGRIESATLSTVLGAAVTFYNAARAANCMPVVWSIQKPERPKAGGGTLPEWAAKAFEVTSLQMDSIFDIIRSRRFEAANIKTNTALT